MVTNYNSQGQWSNLLYRNSHVLEWERGIYNWKTMALLQVTKYEFYTQTIQINDKNKYVYVHSIYNYYH